MTTFEIYPDDVKVTKRYRRAIENTQSRTTRKTLRKILNDFGYSRRGTTNAEYIQQALAEQGIVIEPPLLAPEYLDEYVTLHIPNAPFAGEGLDKANYSDGNNHIEVDVPDLFGTLFDFVGVTEVSLFRRAFDSANTMALFVVPKGKEIYPKSVILDLLRRSFANKARALADTDVITESMAVGSGEEPVFRFNAGHCLLQETAVSALLNDHDGKNALLNTRFEQELRTLIGDTPNEFARSIIFLVPDLSTIPLGRSRLERLIERVRQHIPLTFELQARFAEESQLKKSDRDTILQALACLAGLPTQEIPTLDSPLETIFVSLYQLAYMRKEELKGNVKWSEAKFGYESEIHVVAKALAVRTLERLYPGEKCQWEQIVSGAKGGSSVSKRPDVDMPGRVWVEVETTRGIAKNFNDYFTTIHAKMAAKAKLVKGHDEFWLCLPNDVIVMHPVKCNQLLSQLQFEFDTYDVSVKIVMIDYDRSELIPVKFPVIYSPRVTLLDLLPEVSSTLNNVITKKPIDDLVAGMKEEIGFLSQNVLMPLFHSDVSEDLGVGIPNGILLYGLPGCGKTLLAEGLALAAGLPYLKIVPSDIISMWLGESIVNVRAQFERAKAVAPCILVIDEIDALLPSRSAGLNMHVDQQNLVNELLTQMNNAGNAGIVVIGTTNRISSLDAAAVRSGRFDYKLPIFPPTPDERLMILRHHIGNIGSDNQLDNVLQQIAHSTHLFTSADLAKIVQDAKRLVLNRRIAGGDPALTAVDLQSALRRTARSLRRSDVAEFIQDVMDSPTNVSRLQTLITEYEFVYGTSLK